MRRFRRSDQRESFLAILKERKTQLRGVQEAARRAITALGGEFGGGRTFVNHVTARVPAERLNDLFGSLEIMGIEINGYDKPNADGRERRLALGIPESGLYGLDGGRGSTRSGGWEVKFGVIETDNGINNTHVSFLDWIGGPNRIVDTDRCTWWFPAGRQCQNSATRTTSSHGTTVTSVMLGSIEQGQDQYVTSTTERRKRSGLATEGIVHYYSYDSRSDLAEAFEEANEDNGIDIVNLSASPGEHYCNNSSLSGVREEIRAATDAGILVVVAAGNDANDQPAGTCTVSSYAAIPDAMAIGATNKATSLAALDTVSLASYSARGSVNATLYGGRVVSTRMIDLVVNGRVEDAAGDGATGYIRRTRGTSFAAPQVAGVAGLLKDWVYSRGSFGGMDADPYALRTLLSVMGDGASSTLGGGSGFGYTVSDHSGFGHLRFVDLDAAIGSGGGWGLQRRYVSQGQVLMWPIGSSGPESSSVKGLKFAALWDWNLFSGSPDIKFELVDQCPAATPVVLRTAARHPHKARMRLRASEMASYFHGRCMNVRMTVEHASGIVPVYTADYFYTNARVHHDMP